MCTVLPSSSKRLRPLQTTLTTTSTERIRHTLRDLIQPVHKHSHTHSHTHTSPTLPSRLSSIRLLQSRTPISRTINLSGRLVENRFVVFLLCRLCDFYTHRKVTEFTRTQDSSTNDFWFTPFLTGPRRHTRSVILCHEMCLN